MLGTTVVEAGAAIAADAALMVTALDGTAYDLGAKTGDLSDNTTYNAFVAFRTQLNKQNVFDDFIAAAEYLNRQHIASPRTLAIEGRSNGGLLIGAVVLALTLLLPASPRLALSVWT